MLPMKPMQPMQPVEPVQPTQQPAVGGLQPAAYAGCKLQAAGYRLQAAGCRLQAAGCRLQAAGCRLQAALDKRTCAKPKRKKFQKSPQASIVPTSARQTMLNQAAFVSALINAPIVSLTKCGTASENGNRTCDGRCIDAKKH